MLKTINISKKEKEEIISNYNNGYSIRKLERTYPYSFTFLQKLVNSYNHEKNLERNYSKKDNEYIKAICKKTGKEFLDYKNESGALTAHLKLIYPSIKIESNYKRKSLEWETGKFWYDEYFEFKAFETKPIKNCSYCNWTTNDTENKSGAYEKHLTKIHGVSIEEHIKNNPIDKSYFNYIPYKNPVICKICGEKLKILNHRHLKKHNITVYEYKLKYDENIISPKTLEKFRDKYEKSLKFAPFKNISTIEIEIKNILNIDNLKFSDRKILNGKEIDIVSETKKTGIEINGCKFHTENFGKKGRNYHLDKTKLANKKGYYLIHLFEDEWFNNNELVKNKINHILGVSKFKSIYARKCKISEIDTTTKNVFLDKNHIQGSDKSNIKLGLFYNEKLVAVMTFNNKRSYNKTKDHNENMFELTRFATDNEYRVIGGASKLLKYFIRNYSPERILSFADRRWTLDINDNLYTKLGFELTKILPPDYTYYNSSISKYKRFHKFNFGKSSIKKNYPSIYDETKTEWEMMQELGYDRIWDCGKIKYELFIK